VYWEGTICRVAVWRMGAWEEHVTELNEDWRIDVSTEYFTKL